jgi:AMMECR1 domain-containing protein
MPRRHHSLANQGAVGVHGIVLQHSEYSATYLPEVAREQAWTKRETLQSLATKAGFNLQDADLAFVKLTRYTSSKAKATYEEWIAHVTTNLT